MGKQPKRRKQPKHVKQVERPPKQPKRPIPRVHEASHHQGGATEGDGVELEGLHDAASKGDIALSERLLA